MGRVTVNAELKCPKCNKKAQYDSNQIQHDHVICIHCNHKIPVIVYTDQANTDYSKTDAGNVVRNHPKIKMTKKERRRGQKKAREEGIQYGK